jgi:hypothetical protein
MTGIMRTTSIWPFTHAYGNRPLTLTRRFSIANTLSFPVDG